MIVAKIKAAKQGFYCDRRKLEENGSSQVYGNTFGGLGK